MPTTLIQRSLGFYYPNRTSILPGIKTNNKPKSKT